MNYETFFVAIKQRVVSDLGDSFDPSLLDHLTLSLDHGHRARQSTNDQYRSKTARIPAFYNPNSHTIHLNLPVLEKAETDVVENIYYHELIHASSHHAKLNAHGLKILKSGLKIQMWDENDRPSTHHRGLNEGLTQYFANCYTEGGPAYRREVQIIGQLIRKIGLAPLKAAYFGSELDQLEMAVEVKCGPNAWRELSELVDKKEYDAAAALIA